MSQPDDLTPEQEQVRRLLADARHTGAVPDDVATRLDAVLADLRAEDPEAAAPVVASRPPTDIAAARRRHNVRSWLVAAAAVVVVGVGVNQIAQSDVSGDDDAAGGSAADSSSLQAERGGAAAEPEDGDGAGGDAASGDRSTLDAVAGPVRLDSDRFGVQVARLRDVATTARGTGTEDGPGAPQSAPEGPQELGSNYAATCPTSGWGRGQRVPVTYDEQPGFLVFRPVRGDTQVVDLFLCGSDQPERSITLPAL